MLRTDNGGELCRNEFEDFCKKCDIKRHNTTPCTPQQNGVAKRMTRTLMENERSILNNARIGHKFWVEVVETACYLVNLSSTPTLVDKAMHEVWTSKKPYIKHLIFCFCDAYVHVPKEKKKRKLDVNTEKCIFIGYKDGVNGFKLWNPITKKDVCS